MWYWFAFDSVRRTKWNDEDAKVNYKISELTIPQDFCFFLFHRHDQNWNSNNNDDDDDDNGMKCGPKLTKLKSFDLFQQVKTFGAGW